jgi:hypothetical protein
MVWVADDPTQSVFQQSGGLRLGADSLCDHQQLEPRGSPPRQLRFWGALADGVLHPHPAWCGGGIDLHFVLGRFSGYCCDRIRKCIFFKCL